MTDAFFFPDQNALRMQVFDATKTRTCTIEAAQTNPGAVGFTGDHQATAPTIACIYEPISGQAAQGLVEVLGAEPGYRVRLKDEGQANLLAIKGGDLITVDGLTFEVVRPPQPRTDWTERVAICIQRFAQG